MKTRHELCAKALLAGCALLMALPETVLADPPPWAPAHGWRKKHDKQYVGYTGSKWDRDYGIVSGRCDRQAITSAVGAAAGAVVGGVIGSQVVKGDGHSVAVLVGAVIGSVVGEKIAREIDDGDRACMGQSLELAASNAPINWVNPTTRVSYVLTPLGGYKQDGQVCREFNLRASGGGDKGSGRAFACQTRDGTWQLAQKEGSRTGNDDRDHEREHPGKGKGKGKNKHG